MCSTAPQKILRGLCFEYDTLKVVRIESKYAGVLSRILQITVLVYVIGYVLVYQKGYQKFDNVQFSVNTKVKGILSTNYSEGDFSNFVIKNHFQSLYNRIWDVNDYVIPAKENNGFFIATNMIITPNQTLSVCKELSNIPGAKCQKDQDCPAGTLLGVEGHGVLTGECRDSVCMIQSWCPVEDDRVFPLKNGKALLSQVKNLTVLIKNQIEFPYYGLYRTNILLSSNASYLSTCLYHEETDPYCPIFKIDYIINKTGYRFEDLSAKGCSISIGKRQLCPSIYKISHNNFIISEIEWECDLDKDFMSYCRPKYSFSRLDNPSTKIAPGWNYRFSNYYSDNRRTLHKVFGINFKVEVYGRAGKFNIIPTVLNLGVGLATLGAVTVVCDFFILYISKDKYLYRIKKFLSVKKTNGMVQDLYDELESDEDQGLQDRTGIICTTDWESA